jgi:hypothetical protein
LSTNRRSHGDAFDEQCAACGRRRGAHFSGSCIPPDERLSMGGGHFIGSGVFIPEALTPIQARSYVRDGGEIMDRVCRNCGLRFGWHQSGLETCPTYSDRFSYGTGNPGTVFMDSGMRRSESEYPRHTPATNLRPEPTVTVDSAYGTGDSISMDTATSLASDPVPTEAPTLQPTMQSMEGWGGWILLYGRDHQYSAMVEAGIPVVPATIVDYGGITGIAIPASELGRVIEQFGSFDMIVDTIDDNMKMAISHENARALAEQEARRLARAAERAKRPASPTQEAPVVEGGSIEDMYNVRAESLGSLEALDVMRPVLKQFAEENKIAIRLKNFHNSGWDETQPPEGKLRIVFWANASRGEHYGYTREKAFGYTLAGGQNASCRESGCADYTIYDDQGEAVAEVLGRTLFVLFDLPHSTNSAATIMGCILSRYKELQANGGVPDVERQKESMYQLYKSVSSVTVEKAKKDIISLERGIAQNISSIEAYTAELTKQKVLLAQLNDGDETAGRQKAADEYERLVKLDHVVTVTFSSGILMIKTDHMNFKYREMWFQGHAYRIIVDTKGGSIKIQSVDGLPLVNGCTHPHLGGDGTPCLGNISKGVYKLLSELEFAALIPLLIEYLQTANTSDWYINPLHWPKVKVEEGAATAIVTPEAASSVPAVVTCPHCGDELDEDYEFCPDCGRCEDCCTCDDDDNGDDESF